MNDKIVKILEIWHERFSNEENQYGEYEPSDIEYFVGCLLYNDFKFSKALDTMRTMDLSYDFLNACSDEYDEIIAIIKSIELEDEMKKVEFLQNFIRVSKAKYTKPELYLLNRLEYHINDLAQRYVSGIVPKKVDFEAKAKPCKVNPLAGI
jgi:hypothetical protein